MDIKKLKYLALISLLCLTALIPLFILVRVLVTTGADTISNDYLRFTNLADRVLSQGYDWRFYMKDSLDNNVHSYAFLFLVRLLLAELTHLSVMAEIYVGLAITFANLLLFFSLLTRFAGIRSPWRFLLLPILSAFTFSYSQISTYSFGETALQMGFTHFWILLGLWMVLFRSKSFLTPWAILIFGILSSFSGGGGLLAWPVFLLALLISNTGSFQKYITWVVGLFLGSFPYLAYSSLNLFNHLNFPTVLSKIITGLGLPLANHINYGVLEHPDAFMAGLIGIGIFICVVLLLFFGKSRLRLKIATPSLLLILWGFLGAVQIGLSRDTLAPWYTTTYILFWIGLLGLCFGLIAPGISSENRKFYFLPLKKITPIAGIIGLLAMMILFLATNLTYTDKSFYLFSRSPTSAACLRNYRFAPTYCEGFVFQWGVGNPSYLSQMGSVLDKYHWSVLGPHQEWTLQGDYIFGNVSLLSPSGPDEVRWVSGSSDKPSYWSADYHHLNLLLHPGQAILWQIDLPSNLSHANFNIGLSLSDQATCLQQNFSIRIELDPESPNLVFQKQGLCEFINEVQLNENLLDYAGKRLTIRITNESNAGEGRTLRLHYPRMLIDENQPAEQDQHALDSIRPLNTDLSPNIFPLKGTEINSNIISTANPELHDLQLQNNNGLMIRNGPSPRVRFTLTQPVCLLDWSRFYFHLALTDSAQKKKVRIGFQFNDNNDLNREDVLEFPLLAGEDMHAYTVDFELFNVSYSACITFVEFKLFDGPNNAPDQWVQISDMGFLPRTPLRFGFDQ